jgi:hypothetical protein
MPDDGFAKGWHDRRRPEEIDRVDDRKRREDRPRLATSTRRAAKKAPSCEDCYFRKNLLCSLELGGPCSTFRPDRPEGLVPPRQPVLLMRTPRWAGRVGATTALAVEPTAGLAERV